MVNMDFVTGLPQTRRQHNLIWVIMDRMTKSTHFFPIHTSYSKEDYARLYLKELDRLCNAPNLVPGTLHGTHDPKGPLANP